MRQSKFKKAETPIKTYFKKLEGNLLLKRDLKI